MSRAAPLLLTLTATRPSFGVDLTASLRTLISTCFRQRRSADRTGKGQVQGQPVPWLPLRQPDRLDGFVKDRGQSDRLLVELDLLRLEPGHLKDVVDQSEQVLTAAVDDRGIFLAASTRRAENSILQDLAHAEYGVQGVRSSWLMVARNSDFARLAVSAASRAARRFVLSPFLVGDVVEAPARRIGCPSAFHVAWALTRIQR